MCSKLSISTGIAMLVTAIHVAVSQQPTGHFARPVLAHSSSVSQSGLEAFPEDEMLHHGRHTANKSWAPQRVLTPSKQSWF